jgi:tetratricopeptide (TPR) repeat protein
MTGVSEPVPVEDVLRQAIAHHQAGRLQEAEQCYRAILQAQPEHPDANHNLGVLAAQVGQPVAGLPYLKTALAVNPAQGQYALSYAEALLAAGQAEHALRVIEEAMQRGLSPTAGHVDWCRRKNNRPVPPAASPGGLPVEVNGHHATGARP